MSEVMTADSAAVIGSQANIAAAAPTSSWT
jgi:hypothetical protein